MFDFSIIKGRDILNILSADYNKIIDIVQEAYVLLEKGEVINPNTYSLKFPQKPNSRINALPAYVGGNINLAGMKWISSFPDNILSGVPRASSVVILNDFATGIPIACLEGSIISAARTAASAVLGANVLRSFKQSSISFIGCGIISKYIFEFFLASGWKFTSINLYYVNHHYATSFRTYISHSKKLHDVNIIIHGTYESAILNSEIVTMATTASEPYLKNPDILAHRPLILNISLRDISPEIIYASNNVVDDTNHCLNAQTSTHLAYLKYGNHDFIHSKIGQLIIDKSRLLNINKKQIIYSPFGMGMLDIAVAAYIYKELDHGGKCLEIHDFFYEQSRWN